MKLFPGFLVSIPDRLFDWKRISLSLFLFSCRHTHRFPAGKIKICYDIRKSFIMALESSGLKVLLTTEPRGGFHFSLSSSLDQGTPLRKGKEKVLFPFARFGSARILQSVLPGRLLSMSPAPVLHILAFNLFHSIKFDYIRLLIAWHTHTQSATTSITFAVACCANDEIQRKGERAGYVGKCVFGVPGMSRKNGRISGRLGK